MNSCLTVDILGFTCSSIQLLNNLMKYSIESWWLTLIGIKNLKILNENLMNFEEEYEKKLKRGWRERERERAGRLIGKEEKKNLKKHGSLEISRDKTQIDILHFWCQMARVQPFVVVVVVFFFLTIVINIIQILYIIYY